MVIDTETQASIDFLQQKLDRAFQSISSMYSALSTGSTWARLNGAILIPDSVDTAQIAPGAITATEIDNDAVTTPKLIANAVTASKLEANLVLSTQIIGGTYDSGANKVHGVALNSSGLGLYDGGGVQRGWFKTDGSGWLGASNKFYWDTSGTITVAGVTVASSATGARTALSTSGLGVYNSSNQLILGLDSTNGLRTFNSTGATVYNQIAMDGSGFLGSPDGTSGNAAISWNTSGTATIKGSKIDSIDAGKITAGTLNVGALTVTGTLGTANIPNLAADKITSGTLSVGSLTVSGTFSAANISGGTLGGGFSLGTQDITVNSTGKIKFGASAADYLANDLLHFEVSDSAAAVIEAKNASEANAHSNITAYANHTLHTSDMRFQSLYDASTYGSLETIVGSTYGVAYLSGSYNSAGAKVSQIAVQGASGNSFIQFQLSNLVVGNFTETNRALTLYGYLYPGSGSGSQASRYIKDNGTQMELATSALRVNLTRTGTAQNWPTGGLPTSVIMSTDAGATLLSIGCEYVTVNFNGTDRKVLCVA